MSVKVPGKIIQSGYGWTLRVTVGKDTALFPSNATFKAQVRRSPEVPDVLYEMTTDNGGITRFNGNSLDLNIPGSVTKDWPSRKAYIDIVRTDTPQPIHLGFRLTVPVQLPVTR